jgi:hypothetical protein
MVTTQSESCLTIETLHDWAGLQSEDARDRALARIRSFTPLPLLRSQAVIKIVSKSTTDVLISPPRLGQAAIASKVHASPTLEPSAAAAYCMIVAQPAAAVCLNELLAITEKHAP